MPNHIQNQLTIKADNLDKILDSIAGEKMLDFEKIIPMPEGLHIETTEHIIEYAKYIFDPTCNNRSKWYFDFTVQQNRFAKTWDDKGWSNFLQCLDNLRQTGFATWYDWSIENWGTKWNAYSFPNEQPASNVIRFQTAWSAPLPVIQKLSEMHPETTLTLQYADENKGYNLGHIVFANGEIVSESHPVFGTDEAWVQAYKLFYPNDTEEDVVEYLDEYEWEPERVNHILQLIMVK